MLALLVVALGLMVCQAKVSNAAEMGTAFTYQGRLIDANNAADGLYDFHFKLFDANVSDTQKGPTIDINDLDVIDGYFTVELDFGPDIFTGSARWLETTVAQSDGSDPCTLTPRVELTPTPYAMQASGLMLPYSGTVSSAASAFLVRNTGPGKAIQGIGQNNDGVTGGSYAAGRSGVFGYNDNASGFGVFGSSINGIGVKGYTYGVTGKAGLFEIQNASNNNAALEAITNGGGSAVSALASAGSGSTYAVQGACNSHQGKGVFGINNSNGNYGYLGGGSSGAAGYSAAGYGVYGESLSSLGRGVYGSASGTSGRGVYGAASNNGDVYNYGGYFTAAGIHGKGVYGAATDNGEGLNVGGYFTASGRVAYGVEGYAPGQLGMGVYGHSPYNGVYGLSIGDNGHGVQGNAIGSGGHGIYGRASGTDGAAIYGRAEDSSVTAIYGHGGTGGKAGYFEGNVHVTGELTKAYTAGTSNPAAPIAYAFIYSDGNVSSGTPNVSCTWNSGYQRYEITISGESYLLWNYVTVVTPTGGAYMTAIGSGGGKMYITIYELSGNKVQAHFQFVTYKP